MAVCCVCFCWRKRGIWACRISENMGSETREWTCEKLFSVSNTVSSRLLRKSPRNSFPWVRHDFKHSYWTLFNSLNWRWDRGWEQGIVVHSNGQIYSKNTSWPILEKDKRNLNFWNKSQWWWLDARIYPLSNLTPWEKHIWPFLNNSARTVTISQHGQHSAGVWLLLLHRFLSLPKWSQWEKTS